MKKLKIIIISSFVILSIWFWIGFSFWNNNPWVTHSDNTLYDLYEERVINHCSEYRIDNNIEIIYLMDESNSYPNLNSTSPINWYRSWRDLEFARNKYYWNMDSIYECAISASKTRSLELLKIAIDNNPEIKSRLLPKIESELRKISQEQNNKDWKNKCKINDDKNNAIIKSSVLKQTTYEICRYNYYLEYLKEYNQWINQIIAMDNAIKENNEIYKDDPNIPTVDNYQSPFDNTNNSIAISRLLELERQKLSEIDREINEAYKAFPMAFHAYSEYENFLSSHILLELIREDYTIFRESLHKALTPINQIWYKAINAMRK